MKKNILPIMFLLLAFSFTACGNAYMGKVIQKNMTREIQHSGEKYHRYVLDHLVLDYTYSVLPNQQLINIKGTIDDRQQDPNAHFVQDEWTLKEAYLDIYFLNADRKAIDVCRKNFPLGHFAFPYPFEVQCRYSPEYKFAAPTYRYKYTKYTSKGKADKIYYHRLETE